LSSDHAKAGAWLAEHRADILAAIRACDRDGLRRPGTRLAAALWPSAGLVPDPGWWQELARTGEELAIADRDPAALAELLHRSAATFAEHGDRQRAEAQWVRALAIIRRAGLDPAAVLTALGTLYREWGRLSKALDADLGLVDLRRAEGDPVGTASALTAVAGTMRDAGRLSSAADYLAQADEALTGITASSPQVRTIHAQILVSWGSALADQGLPGPARRQWSRALAMLIDVDDTAADQVRTLLATADEA
jgi:tetratricopeptide (TPR) repeat protein